MLNSINRALNGELAVAAIFVLLLAECAMQAISGPTGIIGGGR